MPRQYSMGSRTPPQGVGPIPPQAPTSIRERVGALRNLPPFLKLIWQTSAAIGVALIVLRLVRALLPVAPLYVGALVIDAVVAGIKGNDFDPIWRLLALEFALAVFSDVVGRGVSLLDGLLGERFSIATSLRLMQHAASLDPEDFEDSEVQDRLGRARMQASGRRGLMSQLFNQAQDVLTILSFGGGLVVYACSPRPADTSSASSCRRRGPGAWMPAFAGMTSYAGLTTYPPDFASRSSSTCPRTPASSSNSLNEPKP